MNINNMLNGIDDLVEKAASGVESVENSIDPTDPMALAKMQRAFMQYTVALEYQSSVLKALKDIMTSIIAKIG